jgi:segregation and condensation protein B
MSLKAKIEAIIYAAEEPITIDQIASALREAGLLNDLALEPADSDDPKARAKAERNAARAALKPIIDDLLSDYANSDRGMEVRQVANGYRISTKPEHHDVVRAFAKSLKPPIRLSLQALETLAVIAYKQPVTAPEISEIRGVDSSGVLATLIDRKLITTAGRKQVIGRPILYKTTKEFLLRFGLNEISELPSMEEFEKMTQGPGQEELFDRTPVADATGVPDNPEASAEEQPQDAETTSQNS